MLILKDKSQAEPSWNIVGYVAIQEKKYLNLVARVTQHNKKSQKERFIMTRTSWIWF